MKRKRLGRVISQVKNLHSRHVENCEVVKYANSLTSANSNIICFLARHSESDIYQKTIEDKFSITKSTTSKVLKLMEQNGIIWRVQVENDARLKKIVLTEKGNEIYKRIKDSLDSVEELAFTGFSEIEKDQLYDFLERIKNNLKKQ